MISPKLIKVNKEKLLQEKTRLEELLSRIAKEEYPDFGSKDDENAAEVTAYETNIVEERDLEERLRKIGKALNRIQEGTYGICQVGGEELKEARLEAAPDAENCIEHEQA